MVVRWILLALLLPGINGEPTGGVFPDSDHISEDRIATSPIPASRPTASDLSPNPTAESDIATTQFETPGESNSGLGAGAIAGIVIGVIVLVVVIIVIVVVSQKKKKGSGAKSSSSVSSDSALVGKNEES
jgi:hypothetical protein